MEDPGLVPSVSRCCPKGRSESHIDLHPSHHWQSLFAPHPHQHFLFLLTNVVTVTALLHVKLSRHRILEKVSTSQILLVAGAACKVIILFWKINQKMSSCVLLYVLLLLLCRGRNPEPLAYNSINDYCTVSCASSLSNWKCRGGPSRVCPSPDFTENDALQIHPHSCKLHNFIFSYSHVYVLVFLCPVLLLDICVVTRFWLLGILL